MENCKMSETFTPTETLAARPTPAATAVPMRERILDAASELFYAEGFRAVSAEKIIARVGITKVTFYRHFPSKDDLMVAYLELRAEVERQMISEMRAVVVNDPDAGFRLALEALVAASCEPGYRGCPFINAAAEYADPAHPVRVVVARHRRWLAEEFARLLVDLGVPEADAPAAADELMVLRDGAAVAAYLGDPQAVGRALYTSGRAVVRAHLAPMSAARRATR
jgi:AcrR family transcriptional regulator